MIRRSKSGSGGQADQLSFLDPPPAEFPIRATPPPEAAYTPAPRAGLTHARPSRHHRHPALAPPDGAFHAISFVGDRREARRAARRRGNALRRALRRARPGMRGPGGGGGGRLIAVPAGEYDEYAHLDPRVVAHPRLPTRAIYLLVP